MRIIDLSVPIEVTPSEVERVEIRHVSHEETAELFCSVFGCKKEDLPGRMGWANDELRLSTHIGTHVDAPWHYFPTSEGKRARTIDEIPLDWFYGNGVILDMRHKPDGSIITIEDLKEALKKIKYELQEGDIVLVMTGADRYWGKPEYFSKGAGLNRESTLWILDHGIRVVGIDAWGWDRPFIYQRMEYEKTRDASILWSAHRAGIDREYCHIEKLANLDKVPVPYGFKFACFPVKIKNASAAWCRAVAIIE